MSKTLTRLFLILVVVGVIFWFYAPRSFSAAANALITSVDASVAQAQGLAQFVPASFNQSNAGNLQVKMDGLNPNTSYEVTLDQGHCGATGKDLGAVNTDNNGSFYSEFSLAAFNPDSTWYVNIHQQNADGPSIACGQLETNSNAGVLVIGSTPDSSQPLQNDQSPTLTPTATSSPTTAGTPQSGLPNGMPKTGADPGNGQQYDNHTYPRKY